MQRRSTALCQESNSMRKLQGLWLPPGPSTKPIPETTKSKCSYNTGICICNLIRADISALGAQGCTEMPSMIVHRIVNYHAEYLFPVLWKHVEAAIEDTIAMMLLQSNKSIGSEVNSTVAKAVEEWGREKQADCAIRSTTRRILQLKSFDEKITHHIVENHQSQSLLRFCDSCLREHCHTHSLDVSDGNSDVESHTARFL